MWPWRSKKKPPATIPEEWTFFLRRDGTEPYSIVTNLALRKVGVPFAGLRWLLRANFHMKQPAEHGMTSAEEREALDRLEDLATEQAKSQLDALYVGHRIGGGMWELAFYSHSPNGFDSLMKGIGSRAGGYEVETSAVEDPDWSTYLAEYWPTGSERQQIMNRNVIAVLLEHGDTLAAPREVNHWIYFATADARAQFASRVAPSGFQTIGSKTRDTRGNRFCLQISRTDRVDPVSIDQLITELLVLAEEFGGEYDGWETQVVNDTEAPGDSGESQT